jgi:Xaa-Pro aminopeptidase
VFDHWCFVTNLEPGVYIPDEEKYGEFKGIGIRIEDDIYVSEHGPVVLSVDAPKEIMDIEALMKK